MIVAVSDIHAEGSKLTSLWNKLYARGVDPSKDQFVYLGDYVDGGHDAYDVIEALMYFQRKYPQTVCLMGNHEHMLLDAMRRNSEYYGGFWQWWDQGGRETAESYRANDPMYTDAALKSNRNLAYVNEAHMDWMEQLPTLYETKSFYFVHAGLLPDVPAEDTPEHKRLWLRGQFYMSDYDWGKRVIAGHTFHPEPWIKPNLIVMDTMHHGHGDITAALLDDDTGDVVEFVQS